MQGITHKDDKPLRVYLVMLKRPGQLFFNPGHAGIFATRRAAEKAVAEYVLDDAEEGVEYEYYINEETVVIGK